MIIHAGIPVMFRRFGAALNAEFGSQPLLVSANALRKRAKFRPIPADLFGPHDVALDSAGFVAMFRYGGFPWTVAEYVELAGRYPWVWWASMDLCCEPQIARDKLEVRRRIKRTVELLAECRVEATRQGIQAPMPVIQGWEPDDYRWCADLIEGWPSLVGVGSVCRRSTGGALAVVDALHHHLPPHVRLHLFGVKSDAAVALARHPRIASTDSMAWDAAARQEARKAKTTASFAHRYRHLSVWLRLQLARTQAAETWQPDLFARAV